MIQNQAVILCGGKGERLGDALRYCPPVEVPKPMIEVGGKPFVQYAITWLLGIGFTDVVLLVGHKKEYFDQLKTDTVRLVETVPDVDEGVLSIPDLQDTFVLLNGDCYPVMDWRGFCNTNVPRVAVKAVGRDVGIAIVRKEDVISKVVSCGSISGMREVYPEYYIEGGLHVGTPQGLQRARTYMDVVVYGA